MHNDDDAKSWGRLPLFAKQRSITLNWAPRILPHSVESEKFLPCAYGRSYGDSCLNSGHALLRTERLNHFISFDYVNGEMECEAGITLNEIISLSVPKGWFLPVTPGTKFISLGGAIAKDVHGKNHFNSGTFCRHVVHFKLLRSDGSVKQCSRFHNQELFFATIGGLDAWFNVLSEAQPVPPPGQPVTGEGLGGGGTATIVVVGILLVAGMVYAFRLT